MTHDVDVNAIPLEELLEDIRRRGLGLTRWEAKFVARLSERPPAEPSDKLLGKLRSIYIMRVLRKRSPVLR